jgi:AAHS family 4-hydroxybenzoate transporter-like MFS transporter
MADQSVIQVSRLLDERGLSSFQIKLLAWSFFMVLIDGYDITAIAFAAPSLVKEWGLKPGSLGPVFSASLVGILFGSALFGWVGDRYGRNAALVWSNLVFGVFTLAAAYSTDLTQMFWLRLLAGLGIGGVIPNAVAINAESAPRQMRAALAILAVSCVPLGGAIPGFVTAALVPTHGWQILFYIGGIVPIVFALAAWIGLPESIKFMAVHESQRSKMEATIKSIQPDYIVPANAKFVVEDEKQFPGFNPAYLFHDGLALITPLVWLLFALNLMGYFFLISWMPLTMTAANLPPTTAALAGALLQVGGTVGAAGLCWWFQRHRFLALAVMFVCAVPVVAFVGYAAMISQAVLLFTTFLAGLLVLGVQNGMNGVAAMIYPTSLRANGSGWQLGIGRFGSIVGPLAGAVLIGLPVERLYLWGALPFLAAAVVCFIVHRLNTARLVARPELRDAQ